MRLVTDYPRNVRTLEPDLDHAVRRLRLCRADLAARGRRRRSGAGDPRIPALPSERRHGRRATARHFPYLAGPGLRLRCASTSAARASRTGSSRTSTCRSEQLDACEVIAWLAEQSWCTGTVGMIGISWSGFNGLQVAARRPPALKAIVTLCSTDDRYADDVHYDGGCVGSGHAAVGRVDVRLERAPARSRDRGRPLARDVARAHGEGRRRSSTTGSATSAAMTTGSTARCARTTPTSSAPCTRSAAGTTATPTRSCGCSRACPGRARA